MIDLDALERHRYDHPDGDSAISTAYLDDLIVELRAARRVVEAARTLDQWLEVQAAVQPTSKKVQDAWAILRTALAEYDALKG